MFPQFDFVFLVYFTYKILLSREDKFTLFCYPCYFLKQDEAVHRSVMPFSGRRLYSIQPEAHVTDGILFL